MPCYTMKDSKGEVVGFMCGDFGEPCPVCGAVAENFCDYPVGDGKTCDRLLCDDCSRIIGDDIHYCVDHYQEWLKFVESGKVEQTLKNVVPFEKSIKKRSIWD